LLEEEPELRPSEKGVPQQPSEEGTAEWQRKAQEISKKHQKHQGPSYKQPTYQTGGLPNPQPKEGMKEPLLGDNGKYPEKPDKKCCRCTIL